MDHERKRQIRLVVALSAAVLLAVALIYTSFSASSEAKEPSDLLAAGPSGESIQLTGEVVSHERGAEGLEFVITDTGGGEQKLPVSYDGIVPDPFRDAVLDNSIDMIRSQPIRLNERFSGSAFHIK